MGNNKDKRLLSESDAWQANKSSIPLPPSDYPEIAKSLLKTVSDSFGLRDRLESFFKEYYHPFPDFQAVAKGYRSLALQDAWAFHNADNASQNLYDIGLLGINLLQEKTELHIKERILNALLRMISKELAADYLSDEQASRLIKLLQFPLQQTSLFNARASTRLKRMAKKTANPLTKQQIFSLLKDSLRSCCEIWGKERVADWIENYQTISLFHVIQEILDKVENYKKQLDTIEDNNQLLSLPNYEEIAEKFLDKSRKDHPLIQKIELILSLFDFKPLEFYKKDLLNHLTFILRKSEIAEKHEKAQTIFGMVFPFLKKLDNKQFFVTNSIILNLGKQIIPTQQTRTIELFCRHLLTIPFPKPHLGGVDNEWQTRRNPAHLPRLRTYLELFKIDPQKASLLLAGLHVNLRWSGVFINDTDLFQSDVSRMLNSDIRPVYKQVKQICRLFPVFFKEIGAEGKLRYSSTQIDEINNRQDLLIHFFRKQIHIESNNTHIELVKKIFKTWTDGSIDRLEDYVPEEVWIFLQNDQSFIQKTKESVEILAGSLGVKPEKILNLDYELVKNYCEEGDLDMRIAHLNRIYNLLVAKYDLDAVGAREALISTRFIEKQEVIQLYKDIDNLELDKAIERALNLISKLKEIILDPEISEGEERIYRKRHIAAGIPSMYGVYEERKLECLGITYRLERLISILFEKQISFLDLDYITRPALRKIHWILEKLCKALDLDGIKVHELESDLNMLDSALKKEGFSIGQFLNIFQVISQHVRGIIKRYFYNFHKEAITIVGKEKLNEIQDIEAFSEKIMREILSSAFGISKLDSFLSQIITTLGDMRFKLPPEIVNLVLSFNADKALVPLNQIPNHMKNAIWLGNKGYNLALLREFGVKVPEGFVVTTEAYRCRSAMESYPHMKTAIRRRIISEIRRLEGLCGLTLGKCQDGKPPLLLSVRSGSAVSMPGIMMTFLNVGMNKEIAEELANLPNYAWTTWDCYRRMIQIWGMAHGVNRDLFDEIINDKKKKFEINRKLEFSPANMAKLADEYMELINRHEIYIPEDPLEQVFEAMELVFQSWESPMAEIYRNQFDIASEWGTAVIIQRMILGNLNLDSGTGVAMTRTKNRNIELYGDFVPHSQGEDVVSGLVYPYPISEKEKQRREEQLSLEENFFHHYKQIKELAHKLVVDNDYSEQEIEFTFEDSQPENLYILQRRNLISGHGEKQPVFKDSESPVGIGVGAGGGAYSGRAVFNRDGIDKLLKSKDPLLLIRPDTVPDDVDMIFKCDGLLTARGGVTSHAAVTAIRLGKVCIANCRKLAVDDKHNRAKLGNLEINEGDWISINGKNGFIFKGKKEIIHSTNSSTIVEMV